MPERGDLEIFVPAWRWGDPKAYDRDNPPSRDRVARFATVAARREEIVLEPIPMAFHCGQCDEEHEGLPDIGYDGPDPYLAVPKEKRAERTTFTLDRCTAIDDEGHEHYFIRGVIDIPVHGQEEPFGIGVWVSQSKTNYEKYLEQDDDEEREPTLGYVVNRIALYEDDTFLLKARVHFRTGGQRPSFELEPTNHPLAVDQRNGITLERAWQMVHRCMN